MLLDAYGVLGFGVHLDNLSMSVSLPAMMKAVARERRLGEAGEALVPIGFTQYQSKKNYSTQTNLTFMQYACQLLCRLHRELTTHNRESGNIQNKWLIHQDQGQITNTLDQVLFSSFLLSP